MTVTFRALSVAFELTLSESESCVDVRPVTIVVMPLPEMLTCELELKPVPLIWTGTSRARRGTDGGVALAGAGPEVTVRQSVQTAAKVLERLTVTFRAPVGAVAATSSVIRILLELSTFFARTVTPVPATDTVDAFV